ncbi:MAG: glycosyl transferase family 2 [uncultured bacterium (gcode 4)]|uniref:Glycosyl transferase family 2 n=1 Tax=uncultured bacterium (gcode 4) TaxID=1234023 RepID=K1XI10_9BACT|nr:MAG: glycosyl transferase family 2 [uncultured bacterium (gcode 4)]
MKISIITPSYNQEEFIERTILSVISQAGDFEVEYIIMDGLSTDTSIEIIKKYDDLITTWKFEIRCKKLDFIWKSEKDKGQSDAINKGLRLATGDIVTYLNSDDTYNPGALQQVADVLGSSDNKWCYGKCRIIDRGDNEIRKPITLYKNLLGRRYSYAKLLGENFISQMTVFWKREAMDEIGLFDTNEHLCMDYEYWLRMGQKYNPVYINEYMASFRFYHTSKSGSRFEQQFQDELRLAEKYAKWKYKSSLLLHRFNYTKIVFIYRLLGLLKI